MKTKAHQRYYNKAGKQLTGVTTILGVLAKPALIHWSWDLGMQGIDYRKHRDDAAEIGTLAHYLILCHFQRITPELRDYTENQISLAENCLLSFYEWLKGYTVEPILVEASLISEEHQYGGTIDLYCKVNGEYWLVDFKSGKGIYDEMAYQLAAYRQLLVENNYQVDSCRILNIPRAETEHFQEKVWTDTKKEFQLFWHCLSIYNLKKEIGK